MKTEYIQSFIFNKAKYNVKDSHGNDALLKIDFANNKYKIIGDKLRLESKNELSKIAKKLLERKHNNNRAELKSKKK